MSVRSSGGTSVPEKKNYRTFFKMEENKRNRDDDVDENFDSGYIYDLL
jgi:hypothetical protein